MKTSKLAKSTAIYSIGNISNKAVGFILLPIYTTYLTEVDYGILDLLLVSGILVSTFLSFRLPYAIIRWCSEQRTAEQNGQLIFTVFLCLALTGLGLTLLFLPLKENISNFLFDSPAYSPLIRYLIFWIGLEILVDLPMQLLRLEDKAVYFVTLSLIKLFVVLGLNIYFVSYLQTGIEGIMISQLVGSILIITLTLPFLFKRMVFKLDLTELKAMLNYAYPLVFASLASYALTYIDRYIFTYYDRMDLLGTYSLGYKLASVLQVVVISSFQLSYTPLSYQSFGKKNFNVFFSNTLTHYAIVLGFCVSGVALLGGDAVQFLIRDDRFLPSLSVVPTLALYFYFIGLRFMFTLTMHLTKQTKYIVHMVLLGLLINTVLNVIFIPLYGLQGAAASTLFSSIICLVYSYYLSWKCLPMDYAIGDLLKISLLTTLLVVTSLLVSDFHLWQRVAIGLVGLLSFPAFIWYWKVLENEQIKGYWQQILAVLKKTGTGFFSKD